MSNVYRTDHIRVENGLHGRIIPLTGDSYEKRLTETGSGKWVEYDNDYVTGIKVDQLRSGHRTKDYVKLVDPRGFETLMSVKNFVRCLRQNKDVVLRNGQFDTPLCWGRSDGSSMLLVKDSNLTTASLDASVSITYLKMGDYKVGNIYERSDGSKFIFYGKRIAKYDIDVVRKTEPNRYSSTPQAFSTKIDKRKVICEEDSWGRLFISIDTPRIKLYQKSPSFVRDLGPASKGQYDSLMKRHLNEWRKDAGYWWAPDIVNKAINKEYGGPPTYGWRAPRVTQETSITITYKEV